MLVRASALDVCDRPQLWLLYFAERKELDDPTIERLRGRERAIVRKFEETIRAGVETGVFVPVDATVAALGVLGLASWHYHWFRSDRYRRRRWPASSPTWP